jgi:hypothetical protein
MVLVGKPEGKRPLGRPRYTWEDNIKLIFKKWDGEHGIQGSAKLNDSFVI